MKIETREHVRLARSEAREADWKNWGPYVADRAWGTVREDYSPDGAAWDYLPHDHARSRAFRWNEDGLAGFCNRYQNLVLALGLWNEQDPILKERLFGLTGPQGNNGEDVKEYYYYLDSTPTHSYCRMLYKYPQVAYPYAELVEESARRRQGEPEYELVDALGESLRAGRYFDVVVEYAKAGEEDILCRITATNRGPEAAPIHILPQIWYRNDWSWGYRRERPELVAIEAPRAGVHALRGRHRRLEEHYWYVEMATPYRSSPSEDSAAPTGAVAHPTLGRLLFTENETNKERLFGVSSKTSYVKDGINDAVVEGATARVNPEPRGTKAAAHLARRLEPGESCTVRTRFRMGAHADPFGEFDAVFEARQQEADDFFAAIQPPHLDDEARMIQRQAYAGLMWTKQVYHYSVELWRNGDPAYPEPPQPRANGRNGDWMHLHNFDVLSMPDKWEYPWYAAWDLAFHTLPIALLDPEWAKRQNILLLREWYMHPNGQIPAYEWNFSDVNPPVQAWAAWRVYKITRDVTGTADVEFLEKTFQKLLLNFTWWVNRKDVRGRNVFQGGFLGLDNIGVFDRSKRLENGGFLEQADGTAWMGMFCLNMLAMALELARHRPAYEDVATKFFEHFVYIAQAINDICGDTGTGLWHEEDGFYYDLLRLPDGDPISMRVRSLVGLIPLFAVETIDPAALEQLPDFNRRMEWFMKYRSHWMTNMATLAETGEEDRRLLSLVNADQLKRILERMLDPEQFLSDYGLRSLSKEHADTPYRVKLNGEESVVRYEPADSQTGMFGGNSNWRGPIWFPVNFLMIESLERYHRYYGDAFRVECPVGSGQMLNLQEVADLLTARLVNIFRRDEQGHRPFNGGVDLFQTDPHWRDHILFYEYFHGDNGAGVGASHQTGWTALVAKLLHRTNDV